MLHFSFSSVSLTVASLITVLVTVDLIIILIAVVAHIVGKRHKFNHWYGYGAG